MSFDPQVYNNAKLQALLSMVEGRADYFYRTVCRYISKNFNMPLDQVENMDVPWVLRHYYESVYDENYGNDEDSWPELIDAAIMPPGTDAYEEDLQKFIEEAVEENKKELEKKKVPEEKTEVNFEEKKTTPEDIPKKIEKDWSNFIDNPLDEPEGSEDNNEDEN
jgi:hypothetical protein